MTTGAYSAAYDAAFAAMGDAETTTTPPVDPIPPVADVSFCVEIPTLETVRDYVRVPATSLADADLETMRLTALADQSVRCAWLTDCYPAPLAQALLRRVQREIAARNLPLGMVGLEAEYGPANIPAYDALVEHHEAAFRRAVLA